MESLVLLASYALAAVLLYAAYLVLYQYTYWKRRQQPHLRLVPLLGHNIGIALCNLAFADHGKRLYANYPGARYYGMFDLTRPAVVIKDTQLARDIFIRDFESFTDHVAFVSEEMDPIAGRNLFTLEGQRWKTMRNVLSPSFTAARMKEMFHLIKECSDDFVQYFEEHPEVAKKFEARDAFTRYTSDVIATSAFGIKVNSLKDQDNEFYLQGVDATSFRPSFVVKLLLMQIFPKLMRSVGATFLSKATDRSFKKIISETVETRKRKGIVRQDMIHLLMQSMNQEDSQVTIEDIMGQAFIFFLAGFESAASLMCFVAQELATHPDVQNKLYQEIKKQLEEDRGQITYDSLMKMKYLDMVVKETLRLFPPAPFTNRQCVKEYDLPSPMDGYPGCRIEKGTLIMVSIFGLHHDPKYFPEPEKFDPERFSEQNKGNIDQYTYMPFGYGPRQCIGNRFVLMETKIVIVNILRKFVIKISGKSPYPVVFSPRRFTTFAKGGFWLSFEERKKTN